MLQEQKSNIFATGFAFAQCRVQCQCPFISPPPFSFVLYSLHTPLISSSSLHAPISIFARRSSSFSNPFFPSCTLRNRDEEFNDCCSYFRRDCRTLWLMLYQYVNYTVNVKKKRGERTKGERGMGWVSLCGRMREYTVEKCASRRRTICGVISGCEGIVNARGTKRNCFWGYGSAEKYGFTARRMRISLTNVSEVAEREDAGSSLYSFFIALVNHGSSFRILSNRRFLKFLIHRIIRKS